MAMFRAEDVTYTALRALDPSRTICFLPVSALEVHGPHLPLGMDYYMARWMAEETGRRFHADHPEWSVIQYPPLPLGTDELPLAGSMSVPQRTVYRAVIGYGRSLARAGFQYVVVTNGHGGPRHAAALEAACRRVSRKCGIQMFTPSIAVLHGIVTGRRFPDLEAIVGRPLTPEERAALVGGEHAGGWETAFMLAQEERLVEPRWKELGPNGPPHFWPIEKIAHVSGPWLQRLGLAGEDFYEIGRSLAGGVGWLLNTHYGYGGPAVSYQGNPSVASAELGRAFRELMVRDCLQIVEDVVFGEKDAIQVRSIASRPPMIQPWFWRRAGLALAALASALLLLA